MSAASSQRQANIPLRPKVHLDYYTWKEVEDTNGVRRFIIQGISIQNPAYIIVTSYVILVDDKGALTTSGSYYSLGTQLDHSLFRKLMKRNQSLYTVKGEQLVDFGGKYRVWCGATYKPTQELSAKKLPSGVAQ